MDFLKEVSQLPAFKVLKNDLCKNHTIKTIHHILQGSPWALKMLDSSTKIPEGVLLGTLTHMGDFDECLEVNVKEEWGSFKGQHCLVDTNIHLPGKSKEETSVPLTWAVCLPSSCAAADIKDFLTTAFSYPVNVNPLACHIKESRPFTPTDWLAIGILSFFGLLCLLSTGYDLIVSDPRSQRKILLAFSWYTNGKKLLTTKISTSMLECLHGIRFLSASWVVLGHAYTMLTYFPGANMLNLPEYLIRWEHVFISGSVFAVDTFLTLSGILLCYVFMVTMSKERNFNFIAYFLHRYIRITPFVAVIVLIKLSLHLHFGTGPLWDTLNVSHCKENWWATVLHIHNYVVPRSEMCINESWYLSVDMQLYLFSSLLLLPLVKKPKFGLILLEVVTTISLISCFLQSYLDDKPADDFFRNQDYVYTHTRATPWLVGINLGYCLFHTTQWRKDVLAKTKSGLSKNVLCAGWLLASVCLAAPILVHHKLIRDDKSPHSLGMIVFLPLARLVWPLGISWVIFACASGYGGPVNAFLSWKFFTPLSRLTYSIYVLHMSVCVTYIYSSKSLMQNEDMEKVTISFAVTVLSTLLAIPASLTFEVPFIKLQHLLLGFQKKENNIQPEINNASYQEKINNDPPSGAVMIPGSSLTKELNTIPNYNISEGCGVQTTININ